MTDTHFGEHLMLDGYGGDHNKLGNADLITDSLQELPEILDMKILGGPHVYQCTGNDHKDPGGWTGAIIINESHITIHTFPAVGFVSIDVYTCKNGMDCKSIENYFTKTFALEHTEIQFAKRGLQFARAPFVVGSNTKQSVIKT